jgi:opacity protein-like surface antigen
MLKPRKRAATLAVVLGALGVTGAAQAAGGFGGPQYYAGVFAGSISGSGSDHFAGSGAISIPTKTAGTAGLLGGVTFRNGPWLLGGEADYSFGSTRAVNDGELQDIHSNWHLRGRFGYRVNEFDLYITAGYASTGVTGLNPAPVNTTMTGYSIGAGADYPVVRNGVVRLEVLQDNYGSKDFGGGYGINDWKDTTIRAAAIFQF